MPMVPMTLGAAIAAAFVKSQGGTLDTAAAARINTLGQDIASAIHTFNLSADVKTVTVGAGNGAGIGANAGGPIATKVTTSTSGSGSGKLS